MFSANNLFIKQQCFSMLSLNFLIEVKRPVKNKESLKHGWAKISNIWKLKFHLIFNFSVVASDSQLQPGYIFQKYYLHKPFDLILTWTMLSNFYWGDTKCPLFSSMFQYCQKIKILNMIFQTLLHLYTKIGTLVSNFG